MQRTLGTNAKPTTITLHLHFPKACSATVLGFDAEKPKRVYFNRNIGTETPVEGEQELVFPMPLTPKQLSLVIRTSEGNGNVEIKQISGSVLKAQPLQLSEQDKDFLKFATWVAENINELPVTEKQFPYQSDLGHYMLFLQDVLRNPDGTTHDGPAMIHKQTGVMYVSKKNTRNFSIPMLLLALCHENGHYRFRHEHERQIQAVSQQGLSANLLYDNLQRLKFVNHEIDCDRYALNIFLSLGFSLTEAMYTYTKVLYPPNKKMPWHIEERVTKVMDYLRTFDAMQKGGRNG